MAKLTRRYLCHLIERGAWERAWRDGVIREGDEGFVHLSFPDQVIASANLHFQWSDELLVALCEREVLEKNLVLERSRDNEIFPHLYAPLGADQVESIHTLIKTDRRTYEMPDSLLEILKG